MHLVLLAFALDYSRFQRVCAFFKMFSKFKRSVQYALEEAPLQAT